MTRHILVRRAGCVAAWLAATWLGTGTARAQGGVTLDQVARVTMERAPDVLTARENIALAAGQVREARGLFDLRVHFGGSLEHVDTYLSGQSWREEWKRRFQLTEANKALASIRAQMAVTLANGGSARPVCPEGFSLIRDATDPNRLGRPLCAPVTSDTAAIGYGTLDPTAFDSANLFLPPASTGVDPLSALDFVRRYAQINGLAPSDFAEDQRQRGSEEFQNAYRLISEYEDLTALWLHRLGAFPTFEYNNVARLTGDLTKPLRSGGALQFAVVVDSTESRYRDKSADPDFGGKPYQTIFNGRLQASWLQPLLRGRGAASVRAGELSAARNLEASRFTFLHTTSERVLDATLAYLDAVAARQSLTLLEEELTTQRRLLDATTRLAAAGASARVDATRMQARVAEVQASVASARQGLTISQAALAQNIGYTVQDMGAEMGAAERFPDMPPPVDAEALVRTTGARADLRAAEATRDSRRILVEAARIEARPRLDMQLHAAYGTAYYGWFFRVLPDEYRRCTANWADTANSCWEPSDSPLNYYSLSGLGRAFRDRKWEPEVGVQFTFELPFGNNRRLGRLAQSRASLRQAEISLGDLDRVIRENTAQHAASLEKSRDEWLRRREAVERYEATWADTERRRAAGDLSLVDTLKTEQDLTTARLQLVEAQRAFATALAGLRFETGTLVVVRDNRPEANLAGLVVPRQ